MVQNVIDFNSKECLVPVKKVITTSELMEEGTVANLSIDCVILRHTKQKKMTLSGRDGLLGVE